MDRRKVRTPGYKDHWVSMLTAWGPQYFWTATHEQQRTVNQWVRILQRMKLKLWKSGFAVEFFYVCEPNKRGGYHLHVLVKFFVEDVGQVQRLDDSKASRYKALRNIGDTIAGGANKTEVIKDENALRYIVKYMFKGGRMSVSDRYGFV